MATSGLILPVGNVGVPTPVDVFALSDLCIKLASLVAASPASCCAACAPLAFPTSPPAPTSTEIPYKQNFSRNFFKNKLTEIFNNNQKFLTKKSRQFFFILAETPFLNCGGSAILEVPIWSSPH
jgi:hypothetical protein